MKKTFFAPTLIVFLALGFLFSMVSVSAAEEEFKKFDVKIRGNYVLLDEHIDGTLQSIVRLLHGGGQGVIDDAVAPEIDLEYFFAKNFSAELVLAASKHDIMFDNGGSNAGSMWLFFPALFVKYHPFQGARVSPYLGVGANYVMVWDEKRPPFNMNVGNSIGWSAKIGIDIPITKDVFFNLDAMYYSTHHRQSIEGVGMYDLEFNPFIIGSGFGIRF